MARSEHKDIPEQTQETPRRHHGLASAAGISLTELLMSLTLFSITIAGAVGALNAIDTVSTSYISEGEQREANHADFNSAYERISRQGNPVPTDAAAQAQFGLAFVNVPRSAGNCPITAVGNPTGADITFAMAAGCPTKVQLQDLSNLVTARGQEFFLSVKGTGKLCSGSFPTPGDLAGSGPVTVRVSDSNCLIKADNSTAQIGDIIYFPEYQVAHKFKTGSTEKFRARADLA